MLGPGEELKAASAVSRNSDALAAVTEATHEALHCAQIDSASWALVFASVHYYRDYARMLARCSEILKTTKIVGCSASGILTERGEVNDTPVVGVLVVRASHLDIEPFVLPGLERHSRKVAEEICALRPVNATGVVLFPDVFKLNCEPFFEVFNEFNHHQEHPLSIVGGGPSSENPALGTFQFANGQVLQGGVSGFFLKGAPPLHVGVTQACKPVSSSMTVTACEGQWILELDGKPAFQTLREKLPAPLLEDLKRVISRVFLAVPPEPDQPLNGHYLIRNIAGIDPGNNVIACGGQVKIGMPVAFALRNGDSARENLKGVLQELKRDYRETPPHFGLYFNCCARGEALYGIADIDTSYITQELHSFPLIGLSSFAEIGPMDRKHYLHAYTGVLMLA